MIGIGKYQWTAEEYYTGMRVEDTGDVVVVRPQRVEEIKKAEELMKLPVKLFWGAAIILGLVIIAGIVT